jgi:PadR family transcriptional regulator, regulatory protein PadR
MLFIATLRNKVAALLSQYLVLQYTQRRIVMSIRSQLLKGILDGCILAVIEKEPVYGYELSRKLQASGLQDVSEGTIYPVLLRLQKNKWITGEMRPSESGPNRKYYSLTEDGKAALVEITQEWEYLSVPVNQLLKRG